MKINCGGELGTEEESWILLLKTTGIIKIFIALLMAPLYSHKGSWMKRQIQRELREKLVLHNHFEAEQAIYSRYTVFG